ncbi:hypothetical protein FZEAL_5623 [Fusarium zealandicum]|uniref:Uncharacterized protein n=1 Tax=Fusarium zealandicum TaxID=1053134 RepID=A0A8H4UJH6_9HYPO|nr:hypothetical protein FZEAL_5623 [Fusarium zealandicum]
MTLPSSDADIIDIPADLSLVARFYNMESLQPMAALDSFAAMFTINKRGDWDIGMGDLSEAPENVKRFWEAMNKQSATRKAAKQKRPLLLVSLGTVFVNFAARMVGLKGRSQAVREKVRTSVGDVMVEFLEAGGVDGSTGDGLQHPQITFLSLDPPITMHMWEMLGAYKRRGPMCNAMLDQRDGA